MVVTPRMMARTSSASRQPRRSISHPATGRKIVLASPATMEVRLNQTKLNKKTAFSGGSPQNEIRKMDRIEQTLACVSPQEKLVSEFMAVSRRSSSDFSQPLPVAIESED
jgi:hypothetical protein